jgi:hypothetical protein
VIGSYINLDRRSSRVAASSLRTAAAEFPTFSMTLCNRSRLTPRCFVQYLISSLSPIAMWLRRCGALLVILAMQHSLIKGQVVLKGSHSLECGRGAIVACHSGLNTSLENKRTPGLNVSRGFSFVSAFPFRPIKYRLWLQSDVTADQGWICANDTVLAITFWRNPVKSSDSPYNTSART